MVVKKADVIFQKNNLTDQATAAEIHFAIFVSEHNLSFLAADHFNKLCKVMFLDSNIAPEFASGRTKTTAIVKHALVIKTSFPFTILYDGGNDKNNGKYFAIMVRFWHVESKTCYPISGIASV